MCVLRTFHLFNAFPARTVAAVSPSASENKKNTARLRRLKYSIICCLVAAPPVLMNLGPRHFLPGTA